MQGFTIIDLIILVVYLAAVLFAGLHSTTEWVMRESDRPKQ